VGQFLFQSPSGLWNKSPSDGGVINCDRMWLQCDRMVTSKDVSVDLSSW
jgi:hypothetical protein